MSWVEVKLGDVATFVNGYPFKPTDWKDDGLEIIRIQNLTKGSSETNYFNGIIPEKYKVINGDILISWSATLDIFVWKKSDAWLNQHIFKVVFDKLNIDKRFFIYLIKNILGEIRSQVHGATMQHITKAKFDNIRVYLPPLETQKRIAEILDAADALRQKDHELLKKYDELAQAIFIDMFGDPVKNEKGWELKNLEKITTKLGDGLHGTPNYSVDGNYHFINGNNLINGDIIITELTNKVNEDEFTKHKKDLNENTILVSINGTIGKVAFYKGEKIILGKSACYMNIDVDKVSKIFLYSLLKSSYFLDYAKGNSTGSTIKNVSLKTMREFPIPLPPISEQRKYEKLITLLWETNEIMDRYKEGNLFQSLIQKAFNGELVA
jgi:type I restriction enzyme S subunit